MAWRTVIISNPARLKQKQGSLVIEQDDGSASVPLEDIAALVIDNPQITLTSQLLSACSKQQVMIVTVDNTHTPNGIFLPYLPHSRALKVMRQQLAMTIPHKKRLWQMIIRQKLLNQSAVLASKHKMEASEKLNIIAARVKSGDTDNCEGWGAQIYFNALFGKEFNRDLQIAINAALNYGYAIVRSALARSLVSYGFLPAFGLHHSSEQNSFNLADDLMEPYRPIVDAFILDMDPAVSQLEKIDPPIKAKLSGILHKDVSRIENGEVTGQSTLLAIADATVISLIQCIADNKTELVLPGI